ncbi:PDDEXK nuclease domain-containing protein [Parabacteroides faecis]|uniref:PDDEXK nuclease domain-containing protein n=1 Tax=Parabacteroides faecis TaxID=1217282 RepID=UPI004040BE88
MVQSDLAQQLLKDPYNFDFLTLTDNYKERELEYTGKLSFYLTAVNDLLKHQTDNPTIGLLICKNKDSFIAEYSLKGISQPIGVSEYELTRLCPEDFKGSLPSIEEIEAELKE